MEEWERAPVLEHRGKPARAWPADGAKDGVVFGRDQRRTAVQVVPNDRSVG